MNSFFSFSAIAKILVRLAAILMVGAVASISLAAPVKIWISSQQDKIYYDNMVRLYQQEVDPDFTSVSDSKYFLSLSIIHSLCIDIF